MVRQLESFHTQVTVYDPWANPKEVWEEHQIHSVTTLPIEKYDAIVLAVAHKEFLDLPWKELRKTHSILYDVKGILPRGRWTFIKNKKRSYLRFYFFLSQLYNLGDYLNNCSV